MSSSDIAIRVEDVSMCFEIYATPRDQLKQFILPRLQRLAGVTPKQYYREFWALKDISLEIKKGESIGIVGRNGSGKSTLLQIITGTLSPTTGDVTTHGRVAALLELGSGFNPEFTGRENVYLNAALLGFTKAQIDDKFDSIAAFADIGMHLDQPVKTYSSGMLVRLAFAVQVQVEPDILIIDEALAVGDALFQKRCFQRIERLISCGTTLLFVSHDQESVRTLTNRALLLRRGKAKAWGLSSEVVLEYRRQLHEEESTYFSSITQNLMTRAQVADLAQDSKENEKSTATDFRSVNMSFGDGGVKIIKTETFDANGEKCSVFYPGDKLTIRVTSKSLISVDRLNIAIRIRNKEGVKIYSWGTLNQDMARSYIRSQQPLFWNRKFYAGEEFVVDFLSNCPLGVNLYEIQAAVSYEETMDYMGQRILHWVDEAAFFQVLIKQDEYFFGGVLDMKMSAFFGDSDEF